MLVSCVVVWALAVAVAGCASKPKQDPNVVNAIFGNPATNTPPQGRDILITGSVKNPIIPFYDGLTLNRALSAADYYGGPQLKQINILRAGQQPIYVDPKKLRTQDYLLEPGDRIELH